MGENQNNGGEDGNNGDDNKKLYEGESSKSFLLNGFDLSFNGREKTIEEFGDWHAWFRLYEKRQERANPHCTQLDLPMV